MTDSRALDAAVDALRENIARACEHWLGDAPTPTPIREMRPPAGFENVTTPEQEVRGILALRPKAVAPYIVVDCVLKRPVEEGGGDG